MPEGPSIVILKELLQPFAGKVIEEADGNTKLDIQRIAGQTITGFKSWGKHFLICCTDFTIQIHLMLFGSYSIDTRKKTNPRLSLYFSAGEIHFYACLVHFIDKNLADRYDWSGDIMSTEWDAKKAKQKLLQQPQTMVCDALLDQQIFSGVGNIIKNEVLFRIRVHPESNIGALPRKKLKELIDESRNYSFDFLEWKKNNVFSKHWLAYTKKICPRCDIPLNKRNAGKTKRSTYYCSNCQVLYKNPVAT